MTLIKDRAVIIGQGYVGLPVAMRAVHGGYDVVGFEIDPTKVSALNSGRSHVEDISADQLGEMTKAAAGHELKFSVQIQVGTDKAPPDDVVEQMNKILGGIKKGMKLE